jgi:hypothetical protein
MEFGKKRKKVKRDQMQMFGVFISWFCIYAKEIFAAAGFISLFVYAERDRER